MTSIIPLHIAHRKNSVQTSANVNARFWPSSVTKRPDLAVVDCISIDPRLYRTAVEGVKSQGYDSEDGAGAAKRLGQAADRCDTARKIAELEFRWSRPS